MEHTLSLWAGIDSRFRRAEMSQISTSPRADPKYIVRPSGEIAMEDAVVIAPAFTASRVLEIEQSPPTARAPPLSAIKLTRSAGLNAAVCQFSNCGVGAAS